MRTPGAEAGSIGRDEGACDDPRRIRDDGLARRARKAEQDRRTVSPGEVQLRGEIATAINAESGNRCGRRASGEDAHEGGEMEVVAQDLAGHDDEK
jgi:hypothetical protein